MSEIQAVLFKTPKGWTTTKARAWLKKEKMTPIKRVDKSGILLRYRLREPDYKYYITKSQKNGINFVIGSNKPFNPKKVKSKRMNDKGRKKTITKQEQLEKKREKRTKKKGSGAIKVKLST
jgi:hypothetical protein